MRILISNDDGYRARGINALREALKGLGDITVVAPDRNRSGAGNSLTLDVPLRVGKAEPDVYFVLGTPTDCVHLASSGLFPFEPDMVVSGINDGSNMGDHVLYYGTVAAATEGRFLGKPAVAVSLNTDDVRGEPDGALNRREPVDGAHREEAREREVLDPRAAREPELYEPIERQGQIDGTYWAAGADHLAFVSTHRDKAIGTLKGDRGATMLCRFALLDAAGGMGGGGSGECQTSRGARITAQF